MSSFNIARRVPLVFTAVTVQTGRVMINLKSPMPVKPMVLLTTCPAIPNQGELKGLIAKFHVFM